MTQRNNITGIVIAGGKSSRMGANKVLMNYKGRRLIDWVIQILQPVTNQILISSNTNEIPGVNFSVINDEFLEIGPIAGLYTCLAASTTEINLVIPCDVPEMETSLYVKLLEEAEKYDAVIPRLPDGKVEPLIACYKKSILPQIKVAIDSQNFKLIDLLKQLNVKYVDVLDTGIFKNINTLNDLQ